MSHIDPIEDAGREGDRLGRCEAEFQAAYELGRDEFLLAIQTDPTRRLSTPRIDDRADTEPAYALFFEYLSDVEARQVSVLKILSMLAENEGDPNELRLYAQAVLTATAADYGNFCADRTELGLM